MDVLKQIGEKMGLLSTSQQKVATYILDNWEKASFESANTIAKKLNMSKSSVIRTSNALGFDGVPHLQSELRDHMQMHISTVNRMERASRLQSNVGVESTISSVLKQSNENIKGTLQALSIEKIDRVIKLIKNSRNIYVLGMRSSASFAQFLGFNLNLLLGNALVLDSDHGLFEKIGSLTKDDVLIAISFSRYARLSVEATRIAREQNVKIIGITDSHASPIARLCHEEIIAQTSSMHMNNSYVAVMVLFDLLLSVLLLSDKRKYSKKLKALEEGLFRLQIFSND